MVGARSWRVEKEFERSGKEGEQMDMEDSYVSIMGGKRVSYRSEDKEGLYRWRGWFCIDLRRETVSIRSDRYKNLSLPIDTKAPLSIDTKWTVGIDTGYLFSDRYEATYPTIDTKSVLRGSIHI